MFKQNMGLKSSMSMAVLVFGINIRKVWLAALSSGLPSKNCLTQYMEKRVLLTSSPGYWATNPFICRDTNLGNLTGIGVCGLGSLNSK